MTAHRAATQGRLRASRSDRLVVIPACPGSVFDARRKEGSGQAGATGWFSPERQLGLASTTGWFVIPLSREHSHYMPYLFEIFDWSPLHILVPLVIAQRIIELRISRRNAAWLRSRGAREIGADHYPVIVTVHVLWFASMTIECVLLSRHISDLWIPLLVVFLGAQILRYWSIRTLGKRWNTRILVLPKSKRITSGPYRYVRHPNYVAVMIELATLPLLFGAYITAIAISVVNAVVLRKRILIEDQAL